MSSSTLTKKMVKKLKLEEKIFLIRYDALSQVISLLIENLNGFIILSLQYQINIITNILAMVNTGDNQQRQMLKEVLKIVFQLNKERQFQAIKILNYIKSLKPGDIHKHYDDFSFQQLEESCQVIKHALLNTYVPITSLVGVKTMILIASALGFANLNANTSKKGLTPEVIIETILRKQNCSIMAIYVDEKTPAKYILDLNSDKYYHLTQDDYAGSADIARDSNLRIFVTQEMSGIQYLKNIQSLYLLHCGNNNLQLNTPEVLTEITVMNMKKLNLTGCTNIKNISLSNVEKLHLEPLYAMQHVNNCYINTVKFIEKDTMVYLNVLLLSNWKQLQILILKSCPISKIIIFDFPMRQLKTISIKMVEALAITIYTDICQLEQLEYLSTDIPVELIGVQQLKLLCSEYRIKQSTTISKKHVVKPTIKQLQQAYCSQQIINIFQNQDNTLLHQLLYQLWDLYGRVVIEYQQYYILKCMEIIAKDPDQQMQQLNIINKSTIQEFKQQLIYCFENLENTYQVSDNVKQFLAQVFNYLVFKIGIKKDKGYDQFDCVLPLSLQLAVQLKINGENNIQLIYDQKTKQTLTLEQATEKLNQHDDYIGLIYGNHRNEIFNKNIKLQALHCYNINEECLPQLYDPRCLQSLSISDSSASNLKQCSQLQILCFNQVRNVNIQNFQHLRALKSLHMASVQFVSDDGYGTIFKFKYLIQQIGLEYLYITKCETEEIMQCDFPMPKLRIVRMVLFENNLLAVVFEGHKCNLQNLELIQCDANVHIITDYDLPRLQSIKSHNSNNIIKCSELYNDYNYEPQEIIPIVSNNKRLLKVQKKLKTSILQNHNQERQNEFDCKMRLIYHLEKMIQISQNRFTKYMLFLCQELLLNSNPKDLACFQLDNEGKTIAVAQLFHSHVYYNEVNTYIQLNIVKFIAKACCFMPLNINYQKSIYQNADVIRDLYGFQKNALLDMDVKYQTGFFDILVLHSVQRQMQQQNGFKQKIFQSTRSRQNPQKIAIINHNYSNEMIKQVQQLSQSYGQDLRVNQINNNHIDDMLYENDRFQLEEGQECAILIYKPNINHFRFINLSEKLNVKYKRVVISLVQLTVDTKLLFDAMFQTQDLEYLNIKNSPCIQLNNFVNLITLVLTNVQGINYRDLDLCQNVLNVKLSAWLNPNFFADVDCLMKKNSQENQDLILNIQRIYMDRLMSMLFKKKNLVYVEITYSYFSQSIVIDHLPNSIIHLTFFKNDGLNNLSILDNGEQKEKDLQIINFVPYIDDQDTILQLQHPELYQKLLYADCTNEKEIFQQINL